MADIRDVARLVESGWGAPRVLVVGDVMLDRYVWGDVERISPEAPVPVVRATFEEQRPGGAANVAMNLAGLGARVTLAGFAGEDPEQRELESLLIEAGVEVKLRGVPAVPTTTKLRILSGGQQMMRLDRESLPNFSDADYEALLEAALEPLPNASVVVLSDYAKGVVTECLCQEIIRKARERQIPVLVDPKSRNFERYRGATIICPNAKELAIALGQATNDVPKLLDTAQEEIPKLQLQYMAVTLAEKGIAVLRRDSRVRVPAVARQVYDVSGAGDTVIAVLALALASGVDIELAAHVANVAAGIVVSQVGTAPVQRNELLGALSGEIALQMDDKVMGLDRLLRRVAAWRSVGQRIVFTNGCFDILHVGHIRLLEQARLRGDRLLVGLNSDVSVGQLKGPLRPVVNQDERARILAALSAVDAVVIFDESTPLRLIEAIRPDVLVKGGDYTEEAVVGAREVRGWGGRVELIPIVSGASTTRLIAKSAALNAAATSAAVFST